MELLAKVPHALEMVEHESGTAAEDFPEISRDEIVALRQATAPARQPSALANLLAARRAVTQFAAKHLGLNVSPRDVHLAHRPNGKPELRFTEAANSRAFHALDISLADSHGLSVAWIGPSPVGVDIEIVETRDCETWRGLLGDDGYVLALKIERETREPFDSAATRVWTLLEAGKKAFDLRRMVPRFIRSVADSWLLLKADDTGNACELMCALVRHPAESGAVAALAVIVGQSAYTSQAEHQLLKQLGYDETMFGIKMTNDGPHGQVLYFQRFPVAFKDNQSSSGSVAFSKYFDWTGLVREYSVRPYRQGILETMRAEGAGLASQSMKARIWDDIREHDVVEVKVWLERVLESRSSFVTAFEWCVVLPDGTTKKVAYTEQMVTWVRMSGDVNPRMGDLPPIFRKFLDEMAPVRNKHIASVDQADARLLHFQLGDERSIAGNASGEPVLLHEEEFQTTLEESNYVGNIYFAHYAKWLGATRDLWFHKEFPDVFSGTAGQGEFFSILCDIDHLQEAMPFDMVLVRMFLDKLFDTGLDLRFEYFLMDQNRVGRKLAVAKQRVVWVNRNRSIIEAVKLPNELLERLGGLIHTAAPPPYEKLMAAPKREVPAKYRLKKNVHAIRFDYSGPQDQLVATKGFPVLFRDCQTAGKKVEYARYVSWMGDFREETSSGLFSVLLDLFKSERWGIATNRYRVNILGDLSPGDIVVAKLWQERSANDLLWLLKFDWRGIHSNGQVTRVALSEMEFSAVKILAHGVAQAQELPRFMKEFFEDMLPAADAVVKPLEVLPCGYAHLQLGPLLWQGTSLADKKPALFSHEILTTSDNSNWVGNIYFANYGEWMACVRDLYFHRLTPDCFRNSGRDGEWVCLSCAIDHLSEAMPFDRILVTMNVAAIYSSGVDLTFDYFLLENNQIARKLAHGKHTMAWMGRDSRDEPLALELPRNVVETLARELRQ
jgi:acyl-CoA thioesterase FadM